MLTFWYNLFGILLVGRFVFFSFGTIAAYTSWHKVIIKLATDLERDLTEIENELASIGGGFQG